MKLQQLRFIIEISKNEFNVSNAAEALFVSQPGISKQVKELESELGVTIFTRNGKQLTGVTSAGEQIISLAEEIVDKVKWIKDIAYQHKHNKIGTLSIGTTHNQARYVLPDIIGTFMIKYPGIKLKIHQGTPARIAEEASRGMVDLAISSSVLESYDNLVLLPCRSWSHCVVAPLHHPLASRSKVGLRDIAEYPIITYVSGLGGRCHIDKAFEKSLLNPQIVLTAVDADVIKTYVRLGLGIGIVADMAHDSSRDNDLLKIDAGRLFSASVTKIGFRRDLFFRDFIFDFIQLFDPQWDKDLVLHAVHHHQGQINLVKSGSESE